MSAAFNRLLKQELSRVARREARALTEPFRATSAKNRQQVDDLQRRLKAVERQVAALGKGVGRAAPLSIAEPAAAPIVRYSARSMRALRGRFGMSAEDFGKLLGVSSQAVYNWEADSARPRPRLLEAFAALRSLNKREAVARVRAIDLARRQKP